MAIIHATQCTSRSKRPNSIYDSTVKAKYIISNMTNQNTFEYFLDAKQNKTNIKIDIGIGKQTQTGDYLRYNGLYKAGIHNTNRLIGLYIKPHPMAIIHATHCTSRRERPNSIYDSIVKAKYIICLLYTSPSPRDGLLSRMPSSA